MNPLDPEIQILLLAAVALLLGLSADISAVEEDEADRGVLHGKVSLLASALWI